MAKGTGLIGNFKGKVGNTVGYKLSASNNGQTQGIRVYQPIVKNPRTAAQAEQRAKLLAVNVTYRALKMVIDRGNEGLPYGNKSRLAWLKGALKAESMPWYEKGAVVKFPVGCPLTKGSLSPLSFNVGEDTLNLIIPGVTSATDVSTVGAVSTLLMAAYPLIKKGDQVTVVLTGDMNGTLASMVKSFIVEPESAVAMDGITAGAGHIQFESSIGSVAGAAILSRLGDNGEHLRSTTNLVIANSIINDAPYDADSKAAAIASYQSSGYVNADWQEDAIQ